MELGNYGIGGNEVKLEASEGIADIPQNRTLMVEQLTKDEPVAPEVVTGLTNIDEVFASSLNAEKQFADRMEKSLRSNKVLQRVLENPTTRDAFVNALSVMLDELKNNEKSNSVNE